MNKNKLRKLISNHDFSLTLFSETDAIVDVAIKTGENAAKVEVIEEQQEKVTEQIEQVERSQKWNDEAISNLYDKVYSLQDKIDSIEVKEMIEEENDPTIHQKEGQGGDTIIEEIEETTPESKGNHWGTMIGTLVFGAVVVFLIKLFESRNAGDKEV